MIKRLFSQPTFEPSDRDLRAKFINGFAWSAIALLVLGIVAYWWEGSQDYTVGILSILVAAMLVALYLLRRGRVEASGILIIVLGWLGVGLQALTADGVKDAIVVAYLALGLLTSIIANQRAGGAIILSGIAVVWLLAILQERQVITPGVQEPLAYARDLSLVFIAITVLVYFSTRSMQNAIEQARKSEEALIRSNESLKELNQTLESRVEARTAELTAANTRNERRARQFEAIARIARAITSLRDEETLLAQLAGVISEQFGFYHVGIFTLDGDEQYAVLRASNSEAGRKMLARRHRLRIGQTGMVGHAAAGGTPRIAPDVDADAAFRENPDLPHTRAELALPLRVGDRTIGVLDVQSTEPSAFQPEDIEVLHTLADQVAIAIQNVRSHEATHRLLDEAQRTSVSYLRDAWRLLQAREKRIGYQVSDNVVRSLQTFENSPQAHQAVSHGMVVVEDGDRATLAIPIRLRDDVVGVLDVQIPAGHEWDPDEVDIARAVADRLSLALESATLLQTTQRRAEIERLTADISGKISSSINLRNVLETAVEELGHALPGSEIVIQFGTGQGTNA